MFSSIILTLIGLLIAYVVIDGFLLYRMSHRRVAKGTPGLIEVLRHWNHDLKLVSMGTLSRHEVDSALWLGGKAALEDEIRRRFTKTKIDHWTLDYCVPHRDLLGRPKHGFWAYNRTGEATIFFYEKAEKAVQPPPPAPPAQAPNTWTDRDERHRIEMYLSNPLAFWLNPDWSDPSQPFWTRDPPPLPNQYAPEDERVERAARIIANGPRNSILEHYTVVQPGYAVFMYDPESGEEFRLNGREYRRAMRLAESRTWPSPSTKSQKSKSNRSKFVLNDS